MIRRNEVEQGEQLRALGVDVGAFLREGQGDGEADAPVAAGDQHRLALQIEVHCPAPPWMTLRSAPRPASARAGKVFCAAPTRRPWNPSRPRCSAWPSSSTSSRNRLLAGTMQLNGAEIPFGNFDDVMKLQQQMLQRMRIPGGDPVNLTESSFTGSIRINGKVIHFQSREEYEEARRAAFGAAANFGAGDVLKRRARAKQ